MAKMSKRWLVVTRSLTLLSLTAILAPLLISDVLEFQDYYGHLADILLPSPLWAPYFAATPARYRGCGVYSFFTDETGIVRYTGENRATTAQDVALNSRSYLSSI